MTKEGMRVAAIIVAAGRGSRAGSAIPKQYRRFGSATVLARTLTVFCGHPRISRVQVVIHPDDDPLYRESTLVLEAANRDKLLPPVAGGASRQASVRAGLEAVARLAAPTVVLVHDAARPRTDAALIDRAIAAGAAGGAAIPGVPVVDTINRVDDSGLVVETLTREPLRAVQTPQAFAFPALLAAHRAAAGAGLDGFTDDGALAAWAGLPVTMFEGDSANLKLTHPEDFVDQDDEGSRALVTRLGTGFDVHRFGEGDHIWLGGVRNADVVLHALTDALLGTLADGDIGVHFPPSDPRWRGAASDRFLAFAADRVRARGGIIDHLDVTVLAEAPRIGTHREAMRAAIAAAAGIRVGQVSIKATTTETLGFTGRREGIAAQAAASVRLPQDDA